MKKTKILRVVMGQNREYRIVLVPSVGISVNCERSPTVWREISDDAFVSIEEAMRLIERIESGRQQIVF